MFVESHGGLAEGWVNLDHVELLQLVATGEEYLLKAYIREDSYTLYNSADCNKVRKYLDKILQNKEV